MINPRTKFTTNVIARTYSVDGFRDYGGADSEYRNIAREYGNIVIAGNYGRTKENYLYVTVGNKGINIAYAPQGHKLIDSSHPLSKTSLLSQHITANGIDFDAVDRKGSSLLGWRFSAEDNQPFNKKEAIAKLESIAKDLNQQKGVRALFKPSKNFSNKELGVEEGGLQDVALAIPMTPEMMQCALELLNQYVSLDTYRIHSSSPSSEYIEELEIALQRDKRFPWQSATYQDFEDLLYHMVKPSQYPLPKALERKIEPISPTAAPSANSTVAPAPPSEPSATAQPHPPSLDKPLTTPDRHLLAATGIISGLSASVLLAAQAVKENVTKTTLRIAGAVGLAIAGICALAHFNAQRDTSSHKEP